MPQLFSNVNTGVRRSDRRVCRRHPVRSLAYVELGEGNGGIVLNVSEGGLAVQAVMSMMSDDLPSISLQLAHSNKQIKTKGRIAWTSEFRKLAGVKFVDLSQEALSQIRQWIALETPLSHNSDNPPVEVSHPVAPIAHTDSQIGQVAPDPPVASLKPITSPVEKMHVQAPEADMGFSEDKMSSVTPAAAAPSTDVKPATSHPPVAFSSPREHSLPPSSPPVDRYGFKVSPPTPSLSSSEVGKSPDRRKTVAVVGLFAIASLAVGWLVGRAGLQRLEGQDSPPENVPTEAQPSVVSPIVSEIEVVDTKNQRWLIPFSRLASPGHNLPAKTGANLSPSSSENSEGRPIPSLPSPSDAKSSASSTSDGLQTRLGAPASANVENISPPLVTSETRVAVSAPPPPARSTPLEGGELHAGELTQRVEPDYPAEALAQRIEGTVKLDAIIDRDGSVKKVEVLSGPRILFQAASDAVRQWHYGPTLLDGSPIQTERQISIKFQLTPAQLK